MAQISVEGRLGADPELKYSPAGKPRASFSLAETHRKKEGDEWVDDSTSWYRVTVWGKHAENVAEGLRKGQPVVVTGELKVREWRKEASGELQRSAEINAKSVGAILRGERVAAVASSAAADPWSTGGFDNESAPF